ncbi:GTP 3',8-cyclase MoaA [Desulfitibacter alkalitolerans]|uniref:GTP 3',8-cyclase MoaA n=1 Tax=Desulfitibacter alkalitolerans TaxID=264641 RepID=UPI0004801700|nr:GTP 3',8-cyclase MoaA [Desulfitibacter alkalitolerans]
MRDQFARNIDYLRLSVTDRCNLRCLYCMPEEGVSLKKHEEILTLEELHLISQAAVSMGIKKIRLTGGEPLVRKGIVDLVAMIKGISGLEELSLTTNGTLLKSLGPALKKAGLDRINISLDTLDAQKYQQITRGGDVNQVLDGIDVALELGLEPVKINCVLVDGFNNDEIHKFVLLAEGKPLHIRFIELMPIGEGQKKQDGYLPLEPLKKQLIEAYGLLPSSKVKANGPADQFVLPGGKGTIGFIGAVTNHFCHKCNRLRVTADGKIKPCLDSGFEVDLIGVLRGKGSQKALRDVFLEAINAKPSGHNMNLWEYGQNRLMSQIGG